MKKAVKDSLINEQVYVQHVLIKALPDFVVGYAWDTKSDMDEHVDLHIKYKCAGEMNMLYDIKRANYSNRYKNWSIPSYINYNECDGSKYFIFIQDDERTDTYANVYVIKRNIINKYIIVDKSNDIYTVIDKDALIKDIQYGPENFFGDIWMIQADETSKALLNILTNKDN